MEICLKCIGDESLRQRVSSLGDRINCSYCKQIGSGSSLEKFAIIVDECFRKFIGLGKHQDMWDDNDKRYTEQDGTPLDEIVQEELKVSDEVANDLISLLNELENCNPFDMDPGFYREGENYKRLDVWDDTHLNKWTDFCERIKFHSRFFDPDSKRLLAELIGSAESELPILKLGPNESLSRVYRVRVGFSRDEAESFARDAATKVWAPPRDKCSAGRMNPDGISVFYGAVVPDVAIAEVRPSVGAFAVVGEFCFQRQIRVLDFTRFERMSTGSIFHPDYEQRLSRSYFLEKFHKLISGPILPHNARLEYLPTQALAEYVSNVLGLDGIVFSSSQTKSDQSSTGYGELNSPSKEIPSAYANCNVALFVSSRPSGMDAEGGTDVIDIWRERILGLSKVDIMIVKGVQYTFQPMLYDILDEIEEERDRY